MLEVVVKDEKVYQELKSMAVYASDLTHVCAFRDSMLQMLLDRGVELDMEALDDQESIPELTLVDGNVMKVVGGQPELLHFLGVRSEFDPTVPLGSMENVHRLLEAGLLKPDKKWLELYKKMGYRDHIKDLVCSKVRFHGKGKLLDAIDGSLTVQSLHFPDAKVKEIPMKQMVLRVVRKVEDVDNERFSQANAYQCDRNGQPVQELKVVVRFYNKCPILSSIFWQGATVTVSTGKVQELHDGTLVMYDPIVLPRGLDLKQDTMVSPPDRKVPADLWRNAYYEFMCRYHWVSERGGA